MVKGENNEHQDNASEHRRRSRRYQKKIQAAPSNVGLMIANAPASFKGWYEFAISILFYSEFDPRMREIVVLRVAHVTRSIFVRLSDEALAQILERYGALGATELVLCISYFNFLSRFLESTRVEIENEAL